MFFGPRRQDYHQVVLDHMKSAQYDDIKTGACFGIAAMGLQAILLRDTEAFSKRMVTLSKTLNNDIIAVMNARRLHIYSTQAFFDGIALYQNPHLHNDLFCESSRINQNIVKTSNLVMPQALYKRGGISEVGHFSGSYTQATLSKALKSLRKQLTHNKTLFPVGILLCNHDHALTIGFDPDHHKWLLIEANTGPAQWLHDHELATIINRLFSKNEVIIFDAKIYVAGMNVNTARNTIAAWKLSAIYLQNHLITPEKAAEKDSDSATLLYVASQNGRLNTVKRLLDNGADINFSSRNMPPALYIAALNGHLEVVKELLNRGAVVDADYYSGVSPLVAATISKHVNVAITLLDAGADFNEISSNSKFLQLLRNEVETVSDVKIR